ncbi:MAG: hypothetical protein WC718_18505 [Phycisphaerales bacterium]|jgi:hypothetical protein
MRGLTLHAHEIRRLLSAGDVLVLRPVKPQPHKRNFAGEEVYVWNRYWFDKIIPTDMLEDCPLGAPGEQRFVRETWGVSAKLPVSAHGDELIWLAYPDMRGYKADNLPGNWRWRSPVTMPRWASRATVTVRDVRVLRVQDVTMDVAMMAIAVQAGYSGTQVIQRDGTPSDGMLPDEEFEADYTARYPGTPWAWAVTVQLTPATPAQEE